MKIIISFLENKNEKDIEKLSFEINNYLYTRSNNFPIQVMIFVSSSKILYLKIYNNLKFLIFMDFSFILLKKNKS